MLGHPANRMPYVCSSGISTERALQRYINFLKHIMSQSHQKNIHLKDIIQVLIHIRLKINTKTKKKQKEKIRLKNNWKGR